MLTVLKHTSRLSGCVLSVVGPIKGIHGITGVKWYRFESVLAEKLVHRALVTTGPRWNDLLSCAPKDWLAYVREGLLSGDRTARTDASMGDVEIA